MHSGVFQCAYVSIIMEGRAQDIILREKNNRESNLLEGLKTQLTFNRPQLNLPYYPIVFYLFILNFIYVRSGETEH